VEEESSKEVINQESDEPCLSLVATLVGDARVCLPTRRQTMAYLMTMDEMIEAIQAELDLDHRYCFEDEGVVTFGDDKIHYVRLPEEFRLTIDGATLFVPRP
jgi:hypothetical protein